MSRVVSLQNAAKDYAELPDCWRAQRLAEAAERFVAWLDAVRKESPKE